MSKKKSKKEDVVVEERPEMDVQGNSTENDVENAENNETENTLEENIEQLQKEIKDQKEKLIHKFTINLNSYEKEFLDNLVDETGASISKYLRKKLIEAGAFGKK